MKRRREVVKGCLVCLGMLVCILDSKTAISGAQDGLDLCIRTVVPSLFPFFLLSTLFTATITGYECKILKPLCRLCRVPAGSLPLLLAGFLGGYPVGAQCVAQACRAGQLDSDDAKRMLGFCNNCGPAFVFGMVGGLFEQWWIAWVLWGIHIAGSLAAAILIPGKGSGVICSSDAKPLTIVQAMQQTVRVMAGVCGWVLIFRVMIGYLQRWILWWLPTTVQVTVYGLLELSNGCVALNTIVNSGLRFVLCSLFVGFGGLCVAMQTFSVTAGIDRGCYFPGKMIQSCISVLLAYLVQTVLFPREQRISLPLSVPAILLAFVILVAFLMRKKQNNSRILQPIGV